MVIAVARPALIFGIEQANVPASDAPETLATKPKCRIRVFVAPAAPRKPFSVAAYVQNGDEQNCTLKLPAGVTFDKDERSSKAVRTPANKGYAVLAWRVIAEKAGAYTLEAVLDNGTRDKATTNVLEQGIFP